jgi:glycine betaine/choline ABC-type transport system substrate-binding protein
VSQPVGWLITWNSGDKKVSDLKCHEDDGSCVPLYTAAPVMPEVPCAEDWLAAIVELYGSEAEDLTMLEELANGIYRNRVMGGGE